MFDEIVFVILLSLEIVLIFAFVYVLLYVIQECKAIRKDQPVRKPSENYLLPRLEGQKPLKVYEEPQSEHNSVANPYYKPHLYQQDLYVKQDHNEATGGYGSFPITDCDYLEPVASIRQNEVERQSHMDEDGIELYEQISYYNPNARQTSQRVNW